MFAAGMDNSGWCNKAPETNRHIPRKGVLGGHGTCHNGLNGKRKFASTKARW